MICIFSCAVCAMRPSSCLIRAEKGIKWKAITETIRICKDRNILREYLLDREKEVLMIMMSLFDEEQIMKTFIKSERYEAAHGIMSVKQLNIKIAV